MNDSNNGKNKFSKFLAGRGFYVALAVCVIGAGTAAWVAVDKTISRIDGSNNEIMEQQPAASQEPTYGFPDLEEAGKVKNDVKAPSSSHSSSSTAPSSSSEASPKSEQRSAAVAAPQKLPPSSYVMPVTGEIFGAYSNGELVRNNTLKEWRTHDGIDIKAEMGTVVKAVNDGKVTAVNDDPLMGVTVEIKHDTGVTSIYSGLQKDVSVKVGDKVKVGQAIGKIGEVPSEILLGPHLHFAMKSADGKWLDPLKTMGKI